MSGSSSTPLSYAVAVIIPTFNRAGFLPVTLDSFLSQEFPNLHIFIMDDGSRDQTSDLIRKYQMKYPNLHYYHHYNQGEAFTVNEGMRTVYNDLPDVKYISIVSSDDPVLPGFLRILTQYLDQNGEADIVYPDWYMINEEGRIIRPHRHRIFSSRKLFETCIYQVGPGALFRAQSLKSHALRQQDYKYCGDFNMWLQLALDHTIHHYPAYLATWRLHAGSLTLQGRSDSKAEEFISMIQKFIKDKNDLKLIHCCRDKFLASGYLQAALICWRGQQPMRKYLSEAFRLKPFWSFLLCLRFLWSIVIRRTYIFYYKICPKFLRDL